eukprot:3046400-Prymnesium_polylepis.2
MAARSAAFRKCWPGDVMVRVQSGTDTQAADTGSGFPSKSTVLSRMRVLRFCQSDGKTEFLDPCENRNTLIERGPARNARSGIFWDYVRGRARKGGQWPRGSFPSKLVLSINHINVL